MRLLTLLKNNKFPIFIFLAILMLCICCYINKKTKLTKKQLTFKQALEDIGNILNKHNIRFFLFSGTALGAHREQKFIEHDPDIDLGIFDNDHDISKVTNIVNKSKKFKLLHYYPSHTDGVTSDSGEVTFTHLATGVNIDIFRVSDWYNGKKVCYSYNGICDDKPNKRCEFVSTVVLEKINFMGRDYLIPGIQYLIDQYGHDWTVPKKFSYHEGLEKHYKGLI